MGIYIQYIYIYRVCLKQGGMKIKKKKKGYLFTYNALHVFYNNKWDPLLTVISRYIFPTINCELK